MLIIFFGRVFQFTLLLLVIRIATTYLPPEEMGRLSLITTTVAFFALLFINPVGMFINRRFHAWDGLGRASYYLKLHWLYLLIVCLVAAVCLIVFNQISAFGFQFNLVWLLLLVCGSLLFNTINQTSIPLLNMLEHRGRFILLTLATIVAGLVSSFLLVTSYEKTAELWMFGLLIGQGLAALIGVKMLFNKLRPKVNVSKPTWPHFHHAFHFAWPVAISVGFNWLQTQGYRFFVVDALGLVDLGLFVVGYGISAGLIAAFESVVTTYFQPKFYKNVSGNNSVEQSLAWNKYAGALLPSLIVVMLIIIGLAPELTYLIVGPEYQSASQFIVWGVLAEGGRVIASIYSLSAHAKMKTQLLLVPNIISSCACIALIWALAPEFGASGVGWARALAAFGMVLIMHNMMTRVFNLKVPYILLLKGAALGGILIAVAVEGRRMLQAASSLVEAGVLIIGIGLIFLPIFFWLLYPFLPQRHTKEENEFL